MSGSGFLQTARAAWAGRVAPAPDAVASLYDRAAWRWQAMIGLLGYAKAYKRLLGELAAHGALLRLERQSRVLDAGIGAGALTLALARSTPEPPELHGVDLSARMLARARKTLAQLEQPGLSGRLRLADICRLPYPDAAFDLVMSAHALEHCVNLGAAIADLSRTLRLFLLLLPRKCSGAQIRFADLQAGTAQTIRQNWGYPWGY